MVAIAHLLRIYNGAQHGYPRTQDRTPSRALREVVAYRMCYVLQYVPPVCVSRGLGEQFKF